MHGHFHAGLQTVPGNFQPADAGAAAGAGGRCAGFGRFAGRVDAHLRGGGHCLLAGGQRMPGGGDARHHHMTHDPIGHHVGKRLNHGTPDTQRDRSKKLFCRTALFQQCVQRTGQALPHTFKWSHGEMRHVRRQIAHLTREGGEIGGKVCRKGGGFFGFLNFDGQVRVLVQQLIDLLFHFEPGGVIRGGVGQALEFIYPRLVIRLQLLVQRNKGGGLLLAGQRIVTLNALDFGFDFRPCYFLLQRRHPFQLGAIFLDALICLMLGILHFVRVLRLADVTLGQQFYQQRGALHIFSHGKLAAQMTLLILIRGYLLFKRLDLLRAILGRRLLDFLLGFGRLGGGLGGCALFQLVYGLVCIGINSLDLSLILYLIIRGPTLGSSGGGVLLLQLVLHLIRLPPDALFLFFQAQ